VATASADGTPNVTYISTVHLVDDHRVALSNQFFSKTSRNLAENPRASVLVIDPATYDEHRLELAFERTERRGPLFESMRGEVDAIAALSGMQDVFRLRAADVYRVLHVEPVLGAAARRNEPAPAAPVPLDASTAVARIGDLASRLARAPDLDALVGCAVSGLDDLLGYEHSLLALVDEAAEKLYVIASHGYEREGVGSEVRVGDGPIGLAAQQGRPVRVGALQQMAKYGASVRRSFEEDGAASGRTIELPHLDRGQSVVAVPALATGQLVGVLAVESTEPVAYEHTDEQLLGAVATIVAGAVEAARLRDEAVDGAVTDPRADSPAPAGSVARIRCFEHDGSVFVDDDYLIKGVAGRILAALLHAHQADGRTEFTNRELRLDPTLGLPEHRANLESRLILLKRRLDERDAPVRLDKTGRGRMRLRAAPGVVFEVVRGRD
jgi:GAF domain-containing protein/predicted pyridoxine 5'-phosphate oxidase superfamily flavin-nucleotide-binding protein